MKSILENPNRNQTLICQKKKLRPITCLCIPLPFNSIKQVDLEMVLRFVEGKLNLGIQGQPSKTTERQNIKKKTKKECEH